MTTTIKPVRAILDYAAYKGGAIAIRNALHYCGYRITVRHTPIARVLGCMPKPALERVLRTVRGF
jgi:hypothetical protein